jgi:hypothetical protein
MVSRLNSYWISLSLCRSSQALTDEAKDGVGRSVIGRGFRARHRLLEAVLTSISSPPQEALHCEL